jgi:hypothetical protein
LEVSVNIQLIAELIAGSIVLVSFAVAGKDLVSLVRMNRAAKRKAALEAMPPSEEPLRRAG